ncbi:MAG: hypothetical protein NVS4B8_29620 [Herpetosiphon sp.]
MNTRLPTPYPEVNLMLQDLLSQLQAIVGSHLVGMYLDGSLASGDFDAASDIDFVVVTDQNISSELFASLQAMHDRIASGASPYAIQLEGSYMSQHGLRRHDPAHTLYPNIERGRGERLKMADHDATWLVHRSILRERGITLCGPAPQTLIDPVAPYELQQAMLDKLRGWAIRILNAPTELNGRGSQSYVVLTLCRMLYTLHVGTIVSKPVAARWAQGSLAARWEPLIERAWLGRQNPDEPASPEDVNETLAFIRDTAERSRQIQTPADIS